MSRPSALRPNVVKPILRILWSVLILDERKEGWGDVKRRFWRRGACPCFAYVYRFCFPGNMRVCGHWAGDWCSPCIGTGFDTLTFQSPRKFFGTVNLATFAVSQKLCRTVKTESCNLCCSQKIFLAQ